MSDNATSAPAQSSTLEKGGKLAAVALGGVALAGVIPQDKFPNFWEALKAFLGARWEDVRTGATKFRPIAFAWGAKLWFWAKIWLGLSLALIVAGIEVKTRFGSNSGHVLVGAGTISFIVLGFVLYAFSEGIATILFFKIKVVGGIFKKAADFVGIELPDSTPTEIDERKKSLKKYHDKVKLVLAGTVVLGFSLFFTMLFPQYSTLGWTICFWPLVLVALGAAIYREMEMGKAVDVVFVATIVLLVGMFVVFLLDRLTGGEIGFAPVQEWMRNWNGTEVIWGLQAIIIVGLLIMSGFAKDEAGKPDDGRKSAYRQSAFYLLIAFAVLDVLLLYKGTMSWKEGTGHDAPKVVHETIDKIENASFSDVKSGKSEDAVAYPSSYVPQGTASTAGIYLPPPSGDPMPREEAPSVRPTPKARVKKQPLPELKPKEFDDEVAAFEDLDTL